MKRGRRKRTYERLSGLEIQRRRKRGRRIYDTNNQ